MHLYEINDAICAECRYLRECVDTEVFWGLTWQRTMWECEYVYSGPNDPGCPEHGRWARIVAAGEVDGNYRLEDGEDDL